jgi:hypothetical protein
MYLTDPPLDLHSQKQILHLRLQPYLLIPRSNGLLRLALFVHSNNCDKSL